MNLAVFGATGGTGLQLVAQALAAGHSIRALVRAPGRAGLASDVQLVRGDVRDAMAVAETIAGARAVISCLGTKLTATFTRRGRILASALTHITEAMQAQRVRRLVAVSTYGAGESWRHLGFGARILMGTLLSGELADKNAMEAVVRASLLDWTLLRPVNLDNGPPRGWVVDPPARIGLRDRIPRADVAAFMLAALEDPDALGRSVLITAAGQTLRHAARSG